MAILNKDLLTEGPLIIADFSKYLENHKHRNNDTSHINYKIHYLLEKPFTYINAYARVSKNKGALTKATQTDQEVMRLFGLEKAQSIANKVKLGNYAWQPVRRVWIPKPGKRSLRPIDTPSQEDRITQEAIRGILESIYEPEFVEFEKQNKFKCTNYGFRPNKSTWDAVSNIKRDCQRATYIIEGDIKGSYNSVHHGLLLQILKRRIKDKKFLKLIKNLLKSGVMEKNTYEHNLIGTPQGGIVSPLLFNIYMFEFDKFVNSQILPKINKDSKPRNNPEYVKLNKEAKHFLSLWRNSPKDKKSVDLYYKRFKEFQKLQFKIPSKLISSLPKQARYYRYADDWVILATCSQQEAQEIKLKIQSWLLENLFLTLDPVKTVISRLEDGFSFLGFKITTSSNSRVKLTKVLHVMNSKPYRFLRRTTSRKIRILPDKKRIHQKLIASKFCRNSDLMPIAKPFWAQLEPYAIVLKYKQIMLGIYNYYRDCDDLGIIQFASYVLQYSCAKTIARRKKESLGNIFKKYGKSLTITKEIQSLIKPRSTSVSFDDLQTLVKKNKSSSKRNIVVDFDPFHTTTYWRTKYKFFAECCICGSTKNIEMHHLNSLGKLKRSQDKLAFIRSSLNRIQIPVCRSCHNDITNGIYSEEKPVKYYNEYLARL